MRLLLLLLLVPHAGSRRPQSAHQCNTPTPCTPSTFVTVSYTVVVLFRTFQTVSTHGTLC